MLLFLLKVRLVFLGHLGIRATTFYRIYFIKFKLNFKENVVRGPLYQRGIQNVLDR